MSCGKATIIERGRSSFNDRALGTPCGYTRRRSGLNQKEIELNTNLSIKHRLGFKVTVLIACLLGSGACGNRGEDGLWTIGERSIPHPAGASDELRESIGAVPTPNVKARKNVFRRNEGVEWAVAIEESVNASDFSLSEFAAQHSVEIEPDEIEGVTVYWVTPKSVNPRHENHLFIHLHGGAYVYGAGKGCVTEAAVVASRAGIPSISIDYRMPPSHPFPAAVDDVVAVYGQLLKNLPPKAMAIGGTSAGGGLALASVHQFRALGLAIPGAIYAGTPWADLTKTGDTQFTNEGLDRILVTYDALLGAAAPLYAGGHDLRDPLISPVYGDFHNFPPTYLVSGTRDLFLSDTVRTHRKLRAAGVVADLNVYEGMSHAEYLVDQDTPESHEVYAELGAFLLEHLE